MESSIIAHSSLQPSSLPDPSLYRKFVNLFSSPGSPQETEFIKWCDGINDDIKSKKIKEEDTEPWIEQLNYILECNKNRIHISKEWEGVKKELVSLFNDILSLDAEYKYGNNKKKIDWCELTILYVGLIYCIV